MKIPETIFCSHPFQILRILKTPLFILISIYIKTIIQTILIKTIIEIDKQKAKYIMTACIPIIIIKSFLFFIKKNYNYIKKISSPHNYKQIFCLLNIRMVSQGLHLWLKKLWLIAEHRNITDYENKSAKDLIKALEGQDQSLESKRIS